MLFILRNIGSNLQPMYWFRVEQIKQIKIANTSHIRILFIPHMHRGDSTIHHAVQIKTTIIVSRIVKPII